MTEAITVGIVGCGIIGRNHADAIMRHPRLTVASVIDPVAGASQSLAEHVAERTGTAPSRHQVLESALAGTDLVAICTPSGLHATAAEQALGAGKHVLIEKPLDVSLPAARRIAELATEARANGQVSSVVSQHRFDPAVEAVAESVVDGRLGTLTSAVASVPWWRAQEYYDSAGWRGTWELDGGGAVMNQGVHTVDLLLWLLGRPVEVFARTACLAHERIEVEDVAVATIRFASGALAVYHATTAAYPGQAVRLQVHGTLGSAVIDDERLVIRTADGADRPDVASQSGFSEGHLRQYSDVVAAIDDGRPVRVGIDDGLLALAVVRSVYLSATLGTPVLVDDVLSGALDDVAVEVG